MMNINIGQKGEENWEQEGASGYDTPQPVSPGADVRGNSRAEAEGKDSTLQTCRSEQAPVHFRRQKKSSTTQGLKGEDINDI